MNLPLFFVSLFSVMRDVKGLNISSRKDYPKLGYVFMVYGKQSNDLRVPHLVSMYSLARSTTLRIIAMTTSEIPEKLAIILSQLGIETRRVPEISANCPNLPRNQLDLAGSYTKMNIWNLTDFQQIIYLDSDLLVIENIDSLFNTVPQIGACMTGLRACSAGLYDCDNNGNCAGTFNSGVFVVVPNARIFEDGVSWLSTKGPDPKSCAKGSQGFEIDLVRAHGGFRCIPRVYNCMISSTHSFDTCSMGEVRVDNSIPHGIKVIHWSGPNKPWSHWGNRSSMQPRDNAKTHKKKTLSKDQRESVILWFRMLMDLHRDVPGSREIIAHFRGGEFVQ